MPQTLDQYWSTVVYSTSHQSQSQKQPASKKVFLEKSSFEQISQKKWNNLKQLSQQ